jgi:hypothetical protein
MIFPGSNRPQISLRAELPLSIRVGPEHWPPISPSSMCYRYQSNPWTTKAAQFLSPGEKKEN